MPRPKNPFPAERRRVITKSRKRRNGFIKKGYDLKKDCGYEVFCFAKDPLTHKVQTYQGVQGQIWTNLISDIVSHDSYSRMNAKLPIEQSISGASARTHIIKGSQSKVLSQ
jgi:hypothetical protein